MLAVCCERRQRDRNMRCVSVWGHSLLLRVLLCFLPNEQPQVADRVGERVCHGVIAVRLQQGMAETTLCKESKGKRRMSIRKIGKRSSSCAYRL